MIDPEADRLRIEEIRSEYPDALAAALMMHSNSPLLVLRVLHAFKAHPQLKMLREFDFERINGGGEILRFLRT